MALGNDRAAPVRRKGYEATRRAVLDAAWALAEETGVAGLALREVARRVGLQAPSLYTYFPSKDALFDAMFQEGYEALVVVQQGWAADVAGLAPEAALAYVLREWVDFCAASLARYQLMFTSAVPGWQPSPEAYAASRRQFEDMRTRLPALGATDDEGQALLMVVAAGLVAQQLANRGSGDAWRALAPAAARMLVRDTTRRLP
jgi:AcrR family transcriptional regulator